VYPPFAKSAAAACAVVTAAAIAVPALATPPDIYIPAAHDRPTAPAAAAAVALTSATSPLPHSLTVSVVPVSTFEAISRITTGTTDSPASSASATTAIQTSNAISNATAPIDTSTATGDAPSEARAALAFPPARDAIIAAYNVIVPFVDYGVDLAQYAVGFVPYAGRFAPQVGIFYYDLIRPVATSFIVNAADVLGGGNFPQAVVNVVNDSIRAGAQFVRSQINFGLGFLPPLPFRTAETATPTLSTIRAALDTAEDAGEKTSAAAQSDEATGAEKAKRSVAPTGTVTHDTTSEPTDHATSAPVEGTEPSTGLAETAPNTAPKAKPANGNESESDKGTGADAPKPTTKRAGVTKRDAPSDDKVTSDGPAADKTPRDKTPGHKIGTNGPRTEKASTDKPGGEHPGATSRTDNDKRE
jgi:hypothetical protein